MMCEGVHSDRFGLIDQQSEHSAAFRERTDLAPSFFVYSFVDELGELTIWPAHSQRSVPSVDQFDRCLHNCAQSVVQFQSGSDHKHGFDQAVGPIPGIDL